ncbi:MAG: alpha/beta fold hydrolase [Rhodospirillales bacterium]
MPKDPDDKQADTGQEPAFADGVIEVGGARLRYRAAGDGPALVCLQGDGGATPTRAQALLAAGHRVIVLETPRGDDAAAGLSQALAALVIDRCTLVGASGAATLVLDAALGDASRIDAVVLVAPTAIGANGDPALEPRLAQLELPVLALFGTRDRVAPSTLARRYRELLPNGHIVLVYDAAHAIDSERPEATAEVVADFVAHHERFLVTRTSGMIHP